MMSSKSQQVADAKLCAEGHADDVPERLFTYADVASICRVSEQTLRRWVRYGKVPSPIYVGSTARFTSHHVGIIHSGAKPPLTFPPNFSPRSKVAGKAYRKKLLARDKRVAAEQIAADLAPTASTAATKKRGAK
jgi:hypothetical protein